MAYRSYERASKLIDDVSLANEDEQDKRQDMQIKGMFQMKKYLV